MRFSILIVIWCCASTAWADDNADVDKLVRGHLEASIGRQGALVGTLADKAAIVGANGGLVPIATECGADPKASTCARFVPLFGAEWSGRLAYTNVKPAIRVDGKRGLATFFVTADLAGELAGQGGKAKGKTQMRVAGLAKREKAGWRIVGAKYSAALPDEALAAHGETFASAGGNAPGSKLEKEVAGWFGHLADHQSATAIGLSGTALEELATDRAGIAKLAKAIDGLSLKPYRSGAIESGDMAFVYLDVTLASTKKTVDLNVGIVVVKEGASWKWVAIDFGAIGLTRDSLR